MTIREFIKLRSSVIHERERRAAPEPGYDVPDEIGGAITVPVSQTEWNWLRSSSVLPLNFMEYEPILQKLGYHGVHVSANIVVYPSAHAQQLGMDELMLVLLKEDRL